MACAVAPLGQAATPLLVIDRATGDAAGAAALAAGLGPFPPARGNSYPGLRRVIGASDAAAAGYVRGLLGRLAPVIDRTFGGDGFDLLSASFSIVTTPPDALAPVQRAPHCDAVDPAHLAMMHYLANTADGGTAFFRQRATGIERVSTGNVAAFVAAADAEAAGWRGYIAGPNPSFEEIGRVAGVVDRVVAYPGSLLHSGLIPPDASLSADPAHGRLTANFFVRLRPRR